jgi:hypothetical protein
LNVIGTTQLDAAARVLPHVVAPVLKSLGFVPVIEIELMFSVALPLFVSVTFCEGLVLPTCSPGKLNDVGEKVSMGLEELAPVPCKLTDCGLLLSLSAIINAALRLPVADGLKVTFMLQEAPEVTFAPLVQLVAPATAKSLASAPLMLGAAVIVSVALDWLLTVMFCAAVRVPTLLEKVNVVGETLMPLTGPWAYSIVAQSL